MNLLGPDLNRPPPFAILRATHSYEVWMNTGKLVLAQVTGHLRLTTFRRCVARGTHKVKSFSVAFAQLTYRENLRDIVACLRAQARKLYHMGIKAQRRYSHYVDRTTGLICDQTVVLTIGSTLSNRSRTSSINSVGLPIDWKKSNPLTPKSNSVIQKLYV